jgi:hypothetical protein
MGQLDPAKMPSEICALSRKHFATGFVVSNGSVTIDRQTIARHIFQIGGRCTGAARKRG